MEESGPVAPRKAPRFTCHHFLGVLASQKPGSSEKDLRSILSSSFPQHCEHLPKARNPLQILYGRISKKLADNQDAAGQFLLECGIDAWTAMGRAAALHEPDCKKGCNHEKFPWLWGNMLQRDNAQSKKGM